MKSSRDPRHQKRRELVRELFAISFAEHQDMSELAHKIMGETAVLDGYIERAAPAWPVDKLNKIDLAILRLAVYELTLESVPPKVCIDEAVELAKEFGGESSPSFVNGVLGTILKEIKPDYKDEVIAEVAKEEPKQES